MPWYAGRVGSGESYIPVWLQWLPFRARTRRASFPTNVRKAHAELCVRRKHVFLASEIYVYFALAVLDLLTHTLPSLGSSLDSFRSLDIVIGAGSFIPLFLYTFFLYLLTTTELVPSLSVRLQRIAKYTLLAFIPIILLLNELGSFIGITYRSFVAQDGTTLLGVGFTDATSEEFLSTVTLVLMTAFQAMNFCIAFYRLVMAISHRRSIETSENEKAMEAQFFRGLGWIVVGMKLGAIETVIGFAQGGFGIAFARRLLKFLAHACLVIGIMQGVDTVEDFQLYSPGEAQRRRKSMLRAMIQNPRFSTFRHVGGHEFDAEKTFAPKRDSVIKLGDPSWMRRDFKQSSLNEKASLEDERATPGLMSARKSSSITFKLASRLSNRTSSRKSKASTAWRDSTSSFGSSRRNSWPPARDTIQEEERSNDNADDEDFADEAMDVVATEFSPIPRPAYPRPAHQRVTVHIRKDRLPVLQLRRLSNLEFLDLITDPFRDPHGRARSLPGNFDDLPESHTVGHVSASFTPLPAYTGAPAAQGVTRAASLRESSGSHHARSMSVDVYSRSASVMSQGTVRPSSVATYKTRDSGVSFQAPSVRESVATYRPRDSVASYNPRDSTLSYNRPASTMSFRAIGTPADMNFEGVGIATAGTEASFELPDASGPRFLGMSRRERGLSSSTTASEVVAITQQFPGIPMRPAAVPRPRSMLSHQVPNTEFIVSENVAMPNVSAPPSVVERVPSVKRKPVPTMDEPIVENSPEPTPDSADYGDKAVTKQVEVATQERAITEQEATQSLPTPLSPPHAATGWPAKRSKSLSGKRRPPPLDLAPAEADVFDMPPVATGESGSVSEAQVVEVRSASSSAQGTLVRVKSVGSAPQRSVSASQRTAFARNSVQVELGHVESREERKLKISPVGGAGLGRGRGLPMNPRPTMHTGA
ncbi:hypothetical protein GY45DRAFT_1327525 [Cubamyces sp. BRFM 1775]|nr:hypothetical protein GY45DRAFT_1327525 [Cubamyces sp. BRFM 1775]